MTMNTKRHSKPEKPTSMRTSAFSLQPLACFSAILLAIALFLGGASPGLAQSPSAMNYQGNLTDSVGQPLAPGVYQIQFKIWNSATSTEDANCIWARSFPVYVATNGLFNVVMDDNGGIIGSGPTGYLKDAFAGPDRWLGLSIAATPSGGVSVTNEISPRQKLVSAPYAFHSTEANNAANADRATYALTAANAINANNATNFGNMTTNDFVWVNKSSQTINGDLTINNGLTAFTLMAESMTVFDDSGFAGDLVVGGNASFNGGVAVAGELKAGGPITIANAAPIEIQRYNLPNIAHDDNNGVTVTNTAYSTNQWSAGVIGWQCHANIKADNDGLYRFRATPNAATGCWTIELSIYHASVAVHEIFVDAIFIRKELVKDYR